MKIRLLIPECEGFDGFWSYESKDKVGRIELLNNVMNLGNGISLVVTSNNYFQFNTKPRTDLENFIKQILIPSLNKGIKNKVPLVLGFDFVLNRRTSKTKGKVIKYSRTVNPYGGFDAVVAFLKVSGNSYVYGTHIWECWQSKGKCDPSSFEKQNENRVFKFGGTKIGLLSCGDIANYCHDYGKLLPQANTYLDLSHKSLNGRTSQYHVPYDMVEKWRKCKYVLVTHQVKKHTITRYFKDQDYRFIYPETIPFKIHEVYTNRNRRGVFIDVNIR